MSSRLLALFLFNFLAGSLQADPPAAADADAKKDAAIVNGTHISRDDLLQQIAEFNKRAGDDDKKVPEEKIFEALREEMIRLELLRAAAKASKLDDNPDFKKRMAEARDGILLRFYLKSLQEKWASSLTAEEIKSEVEKLKKTEHVLFLERMIVANEKIAERIKSALKSGKSFASLAKEYAIDKGQPIAMDPIPEAILPADARAMFSKIKPGEIVIIPDKDGKVAVLKYLSRKLLEDEKILEHIARQKLLSEKSDAYVKDLQKNAKIKRFDKDGKEVPAPTGPSPLDSNPGS